MVASLSGVTPLPAPCRTAAWLALLALSAACGGSGAEAGQSTPALDQLAARCGAGWVDACRRAECDPTTPLWQDCRVNGWSGYATPASCPVETGYDGDDRAPCAPEPEAGFQLRFGPLDNSDPTEIERHLVPPGASAIECVYLPLPNVEQRFLGQLVGRIRPGVHHTQLRFVEHAVTSSSNSEFCLPFGGEYVHMGQTREFEVPDLAVPSPTPGTDTGGGLDFVGNALALAPGRVVALELHYINTGTEPILREGWINFYYQKPEKVAGVLHGLMLIGIGIDVPPHSTGVVRRACAAPRALTVTHLQGHSHEGARRFSAWVRRASTGELIPVYESYDPLEPALLTYSPAVVNRAARAADRVPGGASGALRLDAGDAIVWECEIENTQDNPVRDGGPDALGNQMCYVFGNLVSDGSEASGWACGASAEPGY